MSRINLSHSIRERERKKETWNFSFQNIRTSTFTHRKKRHHQLQSHEEIVVYWMMRKEAREKLRGENSISLITNDFKWTFVDLFNVPFLELFMKINVPLDIICRMALLKSFSPSLYLGHVRIRVDSQLHRIVIFSFRLTFQNDMPFHRYFRNLSHIVSIHLDP